MKSSCHILLGVLLSAFACCAADPPPQPPPGADGPWNHRIVLAASPDGLTWIVGEEILADRASVPELFAGPDGHPIVLFVDAGSQRGGLGALVQKDGIWQRRETDLRGADPNVVRLRDGSYRAYTKERDGTIVVSTSRDGLQWERGGEAFRDERYRNSTDSDVFETPDGWVMLISLGPRLLRCTSADGLKFTTDGTTVDLGGSVSDTVKVDGGWRTYFHVNASPGSGDRMRIRSAFTSDGKSWNAEDGDRVVAPQRGPARLGVADPAPLQLADGRWLMALKSFIEPPIRDAQFAGAAERPRRGPDSQQPRNENGPWNNDVIAYRANATGAVEKVATFERAGVPTVTRMQDGRLIAAHQHFPADDPASFDKVAVHFSSDDGATWTGPRVIQVKDLPEGMRFPFDPTLVALPDGRLRLYFTGNYTRTFDRSTPKILSAISTDGLNYTFEPGVRFEVEGRMTIDCAVVLHRGLFHLFVPHNGVPPRPGERPSEPSGEGSGYHATSEDGLHFTRADDVKIEGRRCWLGNAQSDGEVITFFGTGEGFGDGNARPRGGLWMATSTDGKDWKLIPNPAVAGADPGAVKMRDGGWLIVVTGPPVRHTTGELPRPAEK